MVQTFAHTGAVRGVLAHPSTPTVITASADKSVVISPITVQRAIRTRRQGDWAYCLSPDNQRLVTIGPGKECVGYLDRNGQKEKSFATGGDATAAALTKDGQRLAVAGADGSIKLYTVADAKLIGEFKAGGPVIGSRVPPDESAPRRHPQERGRRVERRVPAGPAAAAGVRPRRPDVPASEGRRVAGLQRGRAVLHGRRGQTASPVPHRLRLTGEESPASRTSSIASRSTTPATSSRPAVTTACCASGTCPRTRR